MLLFLLSLSFFLFLTFVYQYFRARISKYIKKKEEDVEFFNYGILLKLFTLFGLIPLMPFGFMLLFTQVYSADFLVNQLQLIIFSLSQIAFCFAIGIYFTSITVEQFVPQSIKSLEFYKPLRIAIKFFHGPVSHVLIYMGISLFLISFSFFDKFKFDQVDVLTAAGVGAGVLLGIFFGVAQRINMTWRYQLPAFLCYFFVLSLLILTNNIAFKQQFTVFNIAWLVFCLVYLIYKYIRASLYKEENLYSEKNWKI